MLLALIRAFTYATLFVALFLVFVPARLLGSAALTRPAAIGAAQIAGGAVAVLGGLLALWCVLTFAVVGRGTPAPFDAPRRLVTSGPYRLVRNPMYVGAGLALAGAALFFQSRLLIAYTVLFFLIAHLFVVRYEEPTLRSLFGREYEEYCLRVRRWWPRW